MLERSASVQARVSSGPWSAARASLDGGAGSEDDGGRRSSGRPPGLGLRDWRKEAALASSPPTSTTLLPPGSASRPVTERRVSQDLERLLGAKVGGGSRSAPSSTSVSPALSSSSTGAFEGEHSPQQRPKKLSLEPPAGLENMLRGGPPSSTSGSPAGGLVLDLPADAGDPSRESVRQEAVEEHTEAGQVVEAQSLPPTTVEIIPPTPLEPSHPPGSGLDDSTARAGSPPFAPSVDSDAPTVDPTPVEPEAAAPVEAPSLPSPPPPPSLPLAETVAPAQPSVPADDPSTSLDAAASPSPSPTPISSPPRTKTTVTLSPAKQPRAPSSRSSSAAPSPARPRQSSVVSPRVRPSLAQSTPDRRPRESSVARPDDGSPGYMRPTSAFSHRAGSPSSLASPPSSSSGASKGYAHRSSTAASSSTPARPRSSLGLHRSTPTRPSSRAASATPTPPPSSAFRPSQTRTARPTSTSRLYSPTASSLAKAKPKVVPGPSPAQGSPRRSGSLRRPTSAASSALARPAHGSPTKASKPTGPPSAFRHAAARDPSGDDDDPEDGSGASATDVRARGASVSSLASGEGEGRKVQGSPVPTGSRALGRA